MLVLFYDKETTGLPLFSEPSEHPDQPHIVQLAAALVDTTTQKAVASIDLVIRPDGWIIPDEVSKIHGITTERAMDEGVREEVAIDMLLDIWQHHSGAPRLRIAHNETFDARIARIAMKRRPDRYSEELCDAWKAGPSECTAILSTPILKLPPTEKMVKAGRRHHKTANLREAYKHFTGLELVDAHSAMPDVQACMAVYFAIKNPMAAGSVVDAELAAA